MAIVRAERAPDWPDLRVDAGASIEAGRSAREQH